MKLDEIKLLFEGDDSDLDIDNSNNDNNDNNLSIATIGRIYELKKIYSRLLAINQMLQSINDPNLVRLSRQIDRCINIFELLASNIEKYLDSIDDIIVQFYKYLKQVYKYLDNYYKNSEENK